MNLKTTSKFEDRMSYRIASANNRHHSFCYDLMGIVFICIMVPSFRIVVLITQLVTIKELNHGSENYDNTVDNV